jgi:hypothetical protein
VVVASDDRGATWSAVDAPASSATFAATRLFVHPGRPDTVYLSIAPTDGNIRFGTFPASAELYRSRDFGRTWTRLPSRGSDEAFMPSAADPLDMSGLYAAHTARSAACGIAVPGCIIYPVFGASRSVDEGLGWNPSAVLPFADILGYAWPTGPTPSAPSRLFVSALNGSGTYVSHDRADSWSRMPTALDKNLIAVYPDPLQRNVLYGVQPVTVNAASVDGSIISYFPVLRSDDEGGTWKVVASLFTTLFAVQPAPPVVIDPARSRIIWLVEYTQVRRSPDRGETWQVVPVPALPANSSLTTSVVPSASDPAVVYLVRGGRLYRGDPSDRPDPVITEFYYDPDRYWVAVAPGEAVSQDYRQQPANVRRTGSDWGAWRADDAPAGAVGSCRFWPKPYVGRTRVIVQQGSDCEILRRDPGWILEAENEFFTLPPANGACPTGTVAVRRYLNLLPDFNHRWVADASLIPDMRARGWADEGVRFCARPLGSNE